MKALVMLKHCPNCKVWRSSHHIFCWQCAAALVDADKIVPGDNLMLDEVATQVFHAAEYVKALEMCNTPTDYVERQKSFLRLTRARATLAELQRHLQDIVSGTQHG
jgi:predicted amidophosphoribosyltransferase